MKKIAIYFAAAVAAMFSGYIGLKKLEEIHDITQDTTLHIECWQKLQNIAATAASALSFSSGIREGKS